MKRRRPGIRPTDRTSDPDDARRIDEFYGLEPVFEPEVSAPSDGPDGVVPYTATCPYCGEDFDTQHDASGGSARYVEDCQVCCQPIEFVLEVDHDGALDQVSVLRGD